jgi:hypothetical protein
MVRDCYTAADQKTFVQGIGKLNDAAKKQNGSNFVDLPVDKRTSLLVALDKEQQDYYKQLYKKIDADMAKHRTDPNYQEPDQQNHYFRMMKELTLFGYVISKPPVVLMVAFPTKKATGLGRKIKAISELAN